jgi:ubiquinone/menaquinone biosynthesis C-methylase UbiE
MNKVMSLITQISPPILLTWVCKLVRKLNALCSKIKVKASLKGEQDLSVYWDKEMAQILDTWGENSVWKEIKLLMINCQGKVLDIACGTGKTMEILAGLSVQTEGCDISDLLISKAIERGIDKNRLLVCDATDMPYKDNSFSHAYSIGSLEHFTETGIVELLQECKRVTKKSSFHMIPVSKSNQNEGWMKTYQSFHNNSIEWWLEKYEAVYPKVIVLDSTWQDDLSVGKWFVCFNEDK